MHRETLRTQGTLTSRFGYDAANSGRVMGHGSNNVDGAMPHLQVHVLGRKVIHIFFPWVTIEMTNIIEKLLKGQILVKEIPSKTQQSVVLACSSSDRRARQMG